MLPDHAMSPQVIYLKDYQEPTFDIHHVWLDFDLRDGLCLVRSRLKMERRLDEVDLVLNGGAGLELRTVLVDGEPLAIDRLHRSGEIMTIKGLPKVFTLELETAVDAENNSRLEGLYKSGGMYCTQCEAEGFRNITFYPDRPDVMALFTVRIEADKAQYPVLLSNGNLKEQGDLPDGRHYAIWDDPFRKPSYLFAVVAGELDRLSDSFTTQSGRTVALHIYAKANDLPKCHHAMESLKRAMAWDEAVFGLEYDLDLYNIVAVSDFNMGAMENKSLNIFNTKYVLADSDSATDTDFDNVEGVIGHEYFHNWTGNRVTCRDWFQLSLKEGLTVFRDQEFSSDQGNRAVQRISDVRVLRSHQFPEDAGPMAHPVRPESYIEINNFYTVTIYNKGAEVIRMIHRILGADGFQKGMKLYIARHDGQAVTCEDFVKAMEDGSGVDLGQFRLWYSQAGTPTLHVSYNHDKMAGTLSLTIGQSIPPTPGQPTKSPMHIPLLVGLIGPNGHDLDVSLLSGDGEKREDGWLLHVRSDESRFVFGGVGEKPVPSLLRGFSAPVIIDASPAFEDRLFQMRHDRDSFARWEATQSVFLENCLSLVTAFEDGSPGLIDPRIVETIGELLETVDEHDPALLAEMLTLPGEDYIGQQMEIVAVDSIHKARCEMRNHLGRALKPGWRSLYDRLFTSGDDLSTKAKAFRALRAVALRYLASSGDTDIALAHYHDASNMTERLAALHCLVDDESDLRDHVLKEFYERYGDQPLVIDKWFAVQAMSERSDTLARVRGLQDHEAFTIRNPNRLRSVVSSFCVGNQVRFHDVSGEGYSFLRRIVADVDPINPQTAARILLPLTRHKRFDAARAAMMRGELEQLLRQPGLSGDVYEIASKSLDQMEH